MFQKLVYAEKKLSIVNGRRVQPYLYRYIVVDSCFEEDIVAARCPTIYDTNLIIELIKIYSRRKLNVVANVVKYYQYLRDRGIDITVVMSEIHLCNTDPTVDYRKHYYPLLRKHYFKHLYQ